VEILRFARVVVILGLLTACSTPLLAHHGNAAYETAKEVTIKGTITDWLWANPHCIMKVDVKDAAGNMQHWVIEALNPPDMVRKGWAKNSFKPGDEVTVTLVQAKNGSPIGRFRGDRSIVLANGQVFSANDPNPAQPAEKP
jgi:hypothetical protein